MLPEGASPSGLDMVRACLSSCSRLDAPPSAVDISEAFLHDAVAAMRLSFPHIDIRAIAADLSTDFVLPADVPEQGRLVFYPGSSIGNFDLPDALAHAARHPTGDAQALTQLFDQAWQWTASAYAAYP